MTFWGTHGCHKQAGHSGIHFCSRGCPVVPVTAWVNAAGFVVWSDEHDRWAENAEEAKVGSAHRILNQEGAEK